jgi:hypothetical protein
MIIGKLISKSNYDFVTSLVNSPYITFQIHRDDTDDEFGLENRDLEAINSHRTDLLAGIKLFKAGSFS